MGAKGTAEESADDALFPDKESAAEADEVWGDGQKAAEEDNPVGTFQININSATLGRAMSSGKLQIIYELAILAGKYKDVVIRKYDGLGSAKQAKITQQQLKRIGIDASRLSVQQLPAALLTLTDKKLVATAKQNGEFYNIYFVRPITGPIGIGESPVAAGVGAGKKDVAAKKPGGGRKF